jgi:putative SOS response-associated peptidase YedK
MADGAERWVMAGLWSTWRDPARGEEVQSCTVLACAPNDAMADRMPVILDERDWPKWLGEETATEVELLALLKTVSGRSFENLKGRQQGRQRQNTGPELILPLQEPLL